MQYLKNPGGFEFDVEGVYEYDNHEIYRKWVALVDKTGSRDSRRDIYNIFLGKFDNVQGYLKLSIAVLGPKDPNPNHDEKDDDDDESTGADLESMVSRDTFFILCSYYDHPPFLLNK